MPLNVLPYFCAINKKLEPAQSVEPNVKTWSNLRLTLYIIGAFVLFLFSLDLMISSLQHVGKNVAETILLATANPFTALFIGLLITAMLQSSSTTTSLVVALVASGSITLQSAIPIIMGANVGTTITSSIVSLGFISKKKRISTCSSGRNLSLLFQYPYRCYPISVGILLWISHLLVQCNLKSFLYAISRRYRESCHSFLVWV